MESTSNSIGIHLIARMWSFKKYSLQVAGDKTYSSFLDVEVCGGYFGGDDVTTNLSLQTGLK